MKQKMLVEYYLVKDTPNTRKLVSLEEKYDKNFNKNSYGIWKSLYNKCLKEHSVKAESLEEDVDDKLVIYKSLGKYRVTPKSNYGSRIQNARKIQKLDDFNSAEEIINYYVTNGWATEDEFEVIDESKKMTERNLKESDAPEGYAPKKQGKAYKVFRVKNGKLYPPMVSNPGGQDTPIGKWLIADEGEFAGLSKTGRPQVKSSQGGTLSYRPGWHLGDVPRASQFDRTNKETGEKEFPKDFVWAECSYTMDVDYQPESDEQGYMRIGKDGKPYRSDKYQHSLAGLPKLPKDGYYKYRTNPRPDTIPWVITGAIKVDRLLSDDEVNEILQSKGIAPIHRQGGDKTLAELGLRESFRRKSRKSLKESKWSNKWPRYMFTFDDGWKIAAVSEEEAEEKYEDIQKNLYNGVRASEELDSIAQRLYDSNDDWSFNYFSDDELAYLWALAFNRSYDDEVYEAITSRPNETEIFEKAKKIYKDSNMVESLTESKKLTEAFDNMEVFMNTWANYNENGADSGITPTGWMSIDDALDYCEEYAEYEPFINDTDNVPFDDINEYSNAYEVLTELQELEGLDVDEDVLKAIIEATGYGLREAIELYQSGDFVWYPGVNSWSDLAYEVIDGIGSIQDALGDRASSYIDYDALKRDLEYDMRDIMRDTAEDEVDEEHRYDDEDEYDREQEIEDWIDEHLDDYLDSYIDDMMADPSDNLIENYFDYEAFGRDLSFDNFTLTDGGAIEIY